MKNLIVALIFTSAALAQTTITVGRATDPLNSPSPQTVTVAPAAGSSSNASSPSAGAAVAGSGTSFGEISDEKNPKKPVVVPQSLESTSPEADAGLNAGLNKLHADTAKVATQPARLHFDDMVDGTDAVSVTVRQFQMFCNRHSMSQDEAEVRQWVKANQNIVASSPSEMLRKQQYPQVRDQLMGLKFPKEWFEGAAAASTVQKPQSASDVAAPATSK
jgi:hypothetical protein